MNASIFLGARDRAVKKRDKVFALLHGFIYSFMEVRDGEVKGGNRENKEMHASD